MTRSLELFWAEDFKGQALCWKGLVIKNSIAHDMDQVWLLKDVNDHPGTKQRVVGIGIERDEDGLPSCNVHLIIEGGDNPGVETGEKLISMSSKDGGGKMMWE